MLRKTIRKKLKISPKTRQVLSLGITLYSQDVENHLFTHEITLQDGQKMTLDKEKQWFYLLVKAEGQEPFTKKLDIRENELRYRFRKGEIEQGGEVTCYLYLKEEQGSSTDIAAFRFFYEVSELDRIDFKEVEHTVDTRNYLLNRTSSDSLYADEVGLVDGKEVYRLETGSTTDSFIKVPLEIPFVVSAYIKLVEPLKEGSKVSLVLSDGGYNNDVMPQEFINWSYIERDTPDGIQKDWDPLEMDVTEQLSTEEFRFVEFVYQVPLEKLQELEPWKIAQGVTARPGIFLENQAVEYHSFYAGIK